MKVYLNLFCIYCIINTNTSFAFAISKPDGIKKHGAIELLSNIKASDFVKFSARDFSLITGKKMNLWNRLSFSFLKMRMKHDLKKDPKLSVNDYYCKKGSRHLGTVWIVLLSIVGLILILFLAAIISYAHHGP